MKDSRSKHFGIFVVDEAAPPRPPPPRNVSKKGACGIAPPPPPPPADWDLPRTPAPLRSQDFMGDVYVSRRRQNRIYKFVFKRKIYIREQTDPSDDEMYKRLDFLQACDEVITGNIPVQDEAEVVFMIAQSVYVDMEEVRNFYFFYFIFVDTHTKRTTLLFLSLSLSYSPSFFSFLLITKKGSGNNGGTY